MKFAEYGFNPRTLGYHFGYDELPVIRRIDELAELEDGWHFGSGNAPSSSVLAIAKVIASYAVSRGLPEIDAFPGKTGAVSIAIYLGEEDHSFQIRPDLSIRYWMESNPDSNVEEGLSLEEAIQRINVLAQTRTSWNLFSSSIFDTGTLANSILGVKLSKTLAMEVEYPWSISTVYKGSVTLSVNTPGGSIQPSAPSPRFSGSSAIPSSPPDTN